MLKTIDTLRTFEAQSEAMRAKHAAREIRKTRLMGLAKMLGGSIMTVGGVALLKLAAVPTPFLAAVILAGYALVVNGPLLMFSGVAQTFTGKKHTIMPQPIKGN